MASDKPISGAGSGPIRVVAGLGGWFKEKILGRAPQPGQRAPLPPRAYDVRKQQLPNTLTVDEWERALDYWDHRCAICERPRGLWHTLAQDHWIPLTHADCPGTVASNILPLCHGEGGCNNSKGKKEPVAWLVSRLGKTRARHKLQEIRAYFAAVRPLEARRLGCPRCGAPVDFHGKGDLWVCTGCSLEWDSATAATMPQCPACQCWMLETRKGYRCPRCDAEWTRVTAPGLEWCPGCKRGVLYPVVSAGETDQDGDEHWWRCPVCQREWVEEDG